MGRARRPRGQRVLLLLARGVGPTALTRRLPARRLPFPLHLYNQFYKNIAISSSGNVQPGITSGGNGTDLTQCLPTNAFLGRPSFHVLWGELGYGPGLGVFVRTTGTAPHRRFMISWQAVFGVTAPTTANAQVTFREDSQTVVYTYGPTTRQNNITIDMQSKQSLRWTTRYCQGVGMFPTDGTKLTFTHSGRGTPDIT